MEPTNVLLGKRITAARKARGWSRSDLARRAGVDPSYVTRIEEAYYKRPSIDKVRALAFALGSQVTDLTEPEPALISMRSVADMRAVLMAKGFRPDQTAVVDQILNDLVGRTEDQQDQIISAVATLVALHNERPDR